LFSENQRVKDEKKLILSCGLFLVYSFFWQIFCTIKKPRKIGASTVLLHLITVSEAEEFPQIKTQEVTTKKGCNF